MAQLPKAAISIAGLVQCNHEAKGFMSTLSFLKQQVISYSDKKFTTSIRGGSVQIYCFHRVEFGRRIAQAIVSAYNL